MKELWNNRIKPLISPAILIITPSILLPIAFLSDSIANRCGCVVLLMATFWSCEPLPVPVTSLFPVFLMPFLGILSSDESCKPYLQEPNMVFMGSLIFAMAVERSNLHKRIALLMLQVVGSSFEKMVLGFMLTTMAVAMWIINTAAAAMMLPIADALLEQVFPTDGATDGPNHLSGSASPRPESPLLQIAPPDAETSKNIHHGHDGHDGDTNNNENQNEPSKERSPNGNTIEMMDMSQQKGDEMENKKEPESSPPTAAQIRQWKKIFYLSIAYSANVGGTATLTSNGPNLILRFVVDSFFSGQAPLDYATWLLFNTPAVIVSVTLTWVAFKYIYFRDIPPSVGGECGKKIMKQKYQELGSVKFCEYVVLILFMTLVSLWMLRDPTFMRGWSTYFSPTKPKDASAVMMVITLLFVIPLEPGTDAGPILTWPFVQSRLAWGVVLLRGGGYALAAAVNKSGLSTVIGSKVVMVSGLSPAPFVIIASLVTAFVTEFASNSAVASVLLPISIDIAATMGLNPFLLLIPLTLSCSFAFILPVGTPANALVFDHAKLATRDMLIPGLVTQTICVTVMVINLYTMGYMMFDLGTVPYWALHPNLPLPTSSNNTTIKV